MSGVPESFLPYGRQSIDDDDIAAVASVLRSDWLTTGPAVDAFEQAFASKLGARFAVACSNGTAALHLAALALELEPGDHVVTPTMSFVATANAARYVGAEVVFADVDPDTGLMRESDFLDALARAGDRPVKAVFPVHLNGQCTDLPAIAEIARERGLRIVEDACHAVGATYEGADGGSRAVGACADSDIAMFSLHAVKTITAGEGGMLTTDDAGLAARLRILRSHGITREPEAFHNADMAFSGDGEANPWYYELQALGYNYRITDFQCALGESQLGKLERFVAKRRTLAARYDKLLAGLAPVVRPVGRVPKCEAAWHLYAVRIDFDAARCTRRQVMKRLFARGVGTQVHYIPVHLQPYYRDRYGALELPGAEAYYASALSLPLYPAMTEADVDSVVERFASALGNT